MIEAIAGLSTWLLGITAALCIALATTVLATRLVRTARDRREKEITNRVRPLVLRILDGDDLPELTRADRAALVSLAADMAGRVRGAERGVLTDWLSAHDFDRDCLRKMRSRVALTRAQALNRFAPMAHLAPRTLELMLRDRDLGVRSLAAQIAGLSGASGLVPALLESSAGPRAIPARIVSMAVLRTAPTSVAAFGGTLSSDNDSVRVLALDLASQLNLVDARRTIEEGLRSPSASVRFASLQAVHRLASPLSLPALERMEHQSSEHSEYVSDIIEDLRVG
tara:strand:+ start:2665 stop:3510 length:846 start_codon:yes stop_codon:yes gene_type:complete